MLNNYVLRSVRYMLDLSDIKMTEVTALGGLTVTQAEMTAWLKKEDDADYQEINDNTMGHFLNGLISFRRGKDDSRPDPVIDARLTNNIMLKKLRVAFELKDADLQDIYKRADFTVSKPELSALFRNPDHKNYRNCGDQLLRYFLKGLTVRLRG